MLTESIFSRFGEVLIVLAADSSVLHLTEKARATLARSSVLRLDRNRLACAESAQTRLLHQRVREVVHAAELDRVIALPLRSTDGSPPALARLCVLHLVEMWQAPVVVLHIAEPDTQPPIGRSDLRELFGLTRTEAAVACAILEADGLQDVARLLGIRTTTARTHLQHVFEKTGTQRQSQLVRLLMSYRSPLAVGKAEERQGEIGRAAGTIGVRPPRRPASPGIGPPPR